MDAEDEDFNKLIELEKKFLTWSGLYPLRKPATCFYHLRASFIYFFSTALIISMTVTLYTESDDLNKITDIMYYLLTQSGYVLKLINFLINRRTLFKIEKCLKSKILYKYYKTYGKSYMPGILLSCKFFTRTFRIGILVLIIFYATVPTFDPEKNLPFAGWYPVDMDKYHIPIYVFQLTCLAVSAYTNSHMDAYSTFSFSIALLCICMLKNCLRHVDYGNKQSGGIKEENLRDLVDIHKHTLYLITLIEETFSYGILVQFLCSISVICLTCFQMLVVTPGSPQFYLLITFSVCMISQVGLYCWFGNEILHEGSGIANACYMSNWYDGTIESKKVLFLMMERSKRDTKFTAGKFFTLSLASFLAILKSAYSFFAVLKRAYTED